jgi:DNA-binding NarL/FixJ family response regulator
VGGPWTPALREAAEPLLLTPREREIVMLVGEGLANRAVADRLSVSVRTVECHVYQAMAKTGSPKTSKILPKKCHLRIGWSLLAGERGPHGSL